MENESNFPLGGAIKCAWGVEGMVVCLLGGGGKGYGRRLVIYSIVLKWHKESGNQVNGDYSSYITHFFLMLASFNGL